MNEADGAETNDGMPNLSVKEYLFLRAALVVRAFYPYLPEEPPGFDNSILQRVGRTGFTAPLSTLDWAEAEHAVKCCLDALHAHAAFAGEFYNVGTVPFDESYDMKPLTALATLLAARVDAAGGEPLRAEAEALRAQRAVAERDAFFASREAAGARPLELSTGELLVIEAALDAVDRDPRDKAQIRVVGRLGDAVILPRHYAQQDLGQRPTNLQCAPSTEWGLSYRVPLTSEEATRLADIVTTSIDALPRGWSGLLFSLLEERFGEDFAETLVEKLRAHAAAHTQNEGS